MNFTEIINQGIFDGANVPRRKRERHEYWPSEASVVVLDKLRNPKVIGKCLRACYYSIMDVAPTNPMSAGAIRKMDIGRAIESQEHAYADAVGVLLEHNTKRTKAYGHIEVHSEIDALYKDEDRKILVDIKSYYGYQAKKEIQGNTRSIGRPKMDHVLQIMLYLDAFPEAEYAKIRYIDRADLHVVEHKVELRDYRLKVGEEFVTTKMAVINNEPSDLTLAGIIDRYLKLDSYVEEEKPPPRDYSPEYSKEELAYKNELGEVSKTTMKRVKSGLPVSDWRCSFCRHRNHCMSRGNE